MEKIALIILAGGSGKRFNSKQPKQYIKIGSYNSIEHILRKIDIKLIRDIVIVYNKRYENEINNIKKKFFKFNFILSKAGITRQESSFNALKKLKKINPKKVIIHDGSRPYIDKNEIKKIISLLNNYDGCAPVIKNVDLLRIKIKNKMFESNSNIFFTQTPQGFIYKKILKANYDHQFLNAKDDISLINNKNYKLFFFEGDRKNIKITYKSDVKFFDFLKDHKIKYGIGYDIHAFDFKSKKKLKLCGVKIDYTPLIGHSDADVGYHSICDSIFGALGIGDIGLKFNNKNSKWKNANSKIFLQYAKNEIDRFKGNIINIDINFICEKPIIKKYSAKMKINISKILKIDKSRINIKATTNEKIGFIGNGNGIAAESIVSIKL